MAKTVADLLVERLIGWGVDTVFGFPGDGVNGLFEALVRGEKDALEIIKTVAEDKVREVI
jgi:thiamine pyrophosphate-dependent acetolactate synthase large subunit-like protein